MASVRAGEGNLPRAPSLLWPLGTALGIQSPNAKEGWEVRGEVPFALAFA